MKVKELIEILNKCNQDSDILCGFNRDNMADYSSDIIEVVETTSYDNENREQGYKNVYFVTN